MSVRDERIRIRGERLFAHHERAYHVRADRLFARLLVFQWLAGVAIAFALSPLAWSGPDSTVHVHVWAAVVLGGAISLYPAFLARRHPGATLVRHTIAIAQMLTSALLIHLTGGRIETHFHVFGSLALLSFYRDWRVLVTATAVVALDHAVRGATWPQSVYGVLDASGWRWLEHVGWVLFENVFLVRACRTSRAEMREMALRRARLEEAKRSVEDEVHARTRELRRMIDELRQAEEERVRLNQELVHAQKLEAVGQLAAGIAHEINTPTQYVGDNARFLQESFESLAVVLEAAQNVADAAELSGTLPDHAVRLRAVLEEADTEYLVEEIPRAIGQSIEGIERVSKIVQAMKEFSHPGVAGTTEVDLNHAIESTVTVATNEWKYVATIETELDPDLPSVPCIPHELNQVVLNLIVNAAHAIADVVGDGSCGKGRITIRTRRDGEQVEIRVADTGAGIPAEIRSRVFDPFFTTKPVGKGTGQGLAIAHNVVVQKHGGTLTLESEVGQGATFVIRLPLERREATELREVAA